MTITEIEKQLSETKTKLDSDIQHLENLRSQRAKLLIKGEDTKEVDKGIFKLEHITTNAPAVVKELENQLVAAQKEKQKKEHERLVSEQKEIAGRIEGLSKQFVSTLRKAVNLNTNLQKEYEIYISLLNKTGQEVMSEKVCQPSYGMLQYLYEIVDQEIKGKRGLRAKLPSPCPQI